MSETCVQEKTSALSEDDWTNLLSRIREGTCTPFLGAEAAHGTLPPRSEIARDWADKYRYPFDDPDDLARVAQFLVTGTGENAAIYNPLFPRDQMVARLRNVQPPDFSDPNEPHRVLADLPLPVYVTTNYDDFMVKALTYRHRNPHQELCRWSPFIPGRASDLDLPTVANPVVFHLNGYVRFLPNGRAEMQQSLVITEDDYLDFLVNTSKDPELIPQHIQSAFTGATLLFLGYRLIDLEFRVLLRSLVGHLRNSMYRGHVAAVQFIQIGGMSTEEQCARVEAARRYLSRYCGSEPLNIKVCPGTIRDFTTELRERWEAFKDVP